MLNKQIHENSIILLVEQGSLLAKDSDLSRKQSEFAVEHVF